MERALYGRRPAVNARTQCIEDDLVFARCGAERYDASPTNCRKPATRLALEARYEVGTVFCCRRPARVRRLWRARRFPRQSER